MEEPGREVHRAAVEGGTAAELEATVAAAGQGARDPDVSDAAERRLPIRPNDGVAPRRRLGELQRAGLDFERRAGAVEGAVEVRGAGAGGLAQRAVVLEGAVTELAEAMVAVD